MPVDGGPPIRQDDGKAWKALVGLDASLVASGLVEGTAMVTMADGSLTEQMAGGAGASTFDWSVAGISAVSALGESSASSDEPVQVRRRCDRKSQLGSLSKGRGQSHLSTSPV